MARSMRWNRNLGIPMSEGGMPICSKHEFIESNLGDGDMGYEMSQAVSAAHKDGQNMEDALKAKKEQIEDANSEIEYMEREIRRLRIAHLRRMAELAEGWGGHMIEKNEEYVSLHPQYAKTVSDGRRLIRFTEACNREITRLTQPR